MPAARRHESRALLARDADRMSRLVDDLFLLAMLDDPPAAHREPSISSPWSRRPSPPPRYATPDRFITLEPLGRRRRDSRRSA
ncbi:hypothetical protein ACFW20_23285 [Streptomyces nigra]|uniref:hypothetical protein n=1 Tax=Streptomyces nigra TaxID=1827580 RepID=UPI0036C7007E